MEELKIQVNNVKIVISLFNILILIISCDNYSKKTNNPKANNFINYDSTLNDSVSRTPNKIQKDDYLYFIPDVKVNDMELVNEVSIVKSVGNLKSLIIEEEELPHVEMINIEMNKKLKLVIFPGSGYNDVYQFSIEYISDLSSKTLVKTNYFDFITENQIKLGISKSKLIDIKGNDYTTNGNIIEYKINYDNDKKNGFLKRYNMPSYYANYTFSNNTLIKIDFGFNYP